MLLNVQQILSVAGFVFVLHRSVTLVNYPLLESDPKPKESHRWRLITALSAPLRLCPRLARLPFSPRPCPLLASFSFAYHVITFPS